MFLEKLNENHESSLRRLSDSHREKIALMERQFLQQKQQVNECKFSTLTVHSTVHSVQALLRYIYQVS